MKNPMMIQPRMMVQKTASKILIFLSVSMVRQYLGTPTAHIGEHPYRAAVPPISGIMRGYEVQEDLSV